MHIFNGMLLGHKKGEIIPFATRWVDLEVIMLNEIKPDRERQIHDFSYLWNLKNKQTKQKQNH